MINNSEGPSGSILTASIQWDFSWPELVEADERHRLFSYLEGRFGIPETNFDDYLVFKRRQSWLLINNSSYMVQGSQLKVSKVGIHAFNRIGAFLKPSTRLIQYFGHTATKARLEINKGQLLELIAGHDIPVDLDLDDGYIILELRKRRILGLGLLINGRVRSQLPRKEAREVMVNEVY